MDAKRALPGIFLPEGFFFVIDKEMEAGSDLDITLTLPAEIINGTDVFVRAQGKVVRVERRVEEGEPKLGVAAVIERYDIIRGENGRAGTREKGTDTV